MTKVFDRVSLQDSHKGWKLWYHKPLASLVLSLNDLQNTGVNVGGILCCNCSISSEAIQKCALDLRLFLFCIIVFYIFGRGILFPLADDIKIVRIFKSPYLKTTEKLFTTILNSRNQRPCAQILFTYRNLQNWSRTRFSFTRPTNRGCIILACSASENPPDFRCKN